MAGEWSRRPPYGGDTPFTVKYNASCFCKRVQFQVSADPVASKLCDCTGCMRIHGAPCQWAALFKKDAVRFLPSSYQYLRWYSCELDRVFTDGQTKELPCKVQCTHCGSFVADEGRQMFMAFPTQFEFVRDDGPPCFPPAFMPTCHIFCASRALQADDGLPQFLDDRKTPLTIPDILLDIAPVMDGRSHKGQGGRIAVLGGSIAYTGAPYYAGMAALRVGAELLYLFTESHAANSLKVLSPELMVTSVYDHHSMMSDVESTRRASQDSMVEAVVGMIPRLHAMVIGCGLGRDEPVLQAVARIIEAARAASLPLVLDADALWLVQQRPEVVKGYSNVVLTPNKAEFARLGTALAGREDVSILEMTRLLQGPTILRKGPIDQICAYDRQAVLECGEPGAPKRPGGLGDLLAGTVGILSVWCKPRRQSVALGCQAGCCLLRRACASAFAKKNRSMVAPDVLEEIGTTFQELCPVGARR